jgi:hypothetical protein
MVLTLPWRVRYPLAHDAAYSVLRDVRQRLVVVADGGGVRVRRVMTN